MMRPVLLAFAALSAPLAVAQAASPAQTPRADSTAGVAYKAPHTSLGQPSLEGVWVSNAILSLESIPEAPALVVTEADAKRISDVIVRSNADLPIFFLDPEVPEGFRETGRVSGLGVVKGERRTRQVVLPADGKLPVTPAARRQIDQIEQSTRGSVSPPLGNTADNPEQRPLWERCVSLQANPPIASPQTSAPLEIIQTREHVILHQDYGGEARIIPLAAKHKVISFRHPLGDSIARWDGETLVIETINPHFADRVRFGPVLLLSPRSKITERLTHLSERELLYQYTIEDPTLYTGPWLAEYSFYRTNDRMYEFACHQGNYSLPNIMKGQRVAEERARKP
jgi:hypothetical protein